MTDDLYQVTLMKPRTIGQFDGVFRNALEETLTDLLGPHALNALYLHLHKHHLVEREQLPYRIETTCTFLQETFGTGGGSTIGKLVARRLYHKLNLHFNERYGCGLLDYVEDAKTRLEKNDQEPAMRGA